MANMDMDKQTTGLCTEPRKWLITGVAGLSGSCLLERLLSRDQHVVGLDNLSSGKMEHLSEVRKNVSERQWEKFTFIEGDIRSLNTCLEACDGVDIVLHGAAPEPSPCPGEDLLHCNKSDATGTLIMLLAAREKNVKSVLYAPRIVENGAGDSPDRQCRMFDTV